MNVTELKHGSPFFIFLFSKVKELEMGITKCFISI